jgi:hypothetical protein
MNVSDTAAATLDTLAMSAGAMIHDAAGFGLPMNEEPLTEFLLLELKRALRSRIWIKTFTKHKEHDTGADWDMFLRFPRVATLPFRVQAKRERDGAFDLLYGRPKMRQLTRLLQSSAQHRMIPMYALYSDRSTVGWHRCHCGRAIAGPTTSLAVLSGGRALELARARTTGAPSVLERASAISCLVRCPTGTANGWSVANRFLNETRHAVWTAAEEDGESATFPDLVSQYDAEGFPFSFDAPPNLPPEVLDLLREPSEAKISKVLSERGVRGIALIDFEDRETISEGVG